MASVKVQAVNGLNFDAVVLRATRPVLVEFSATWCGPCRAQAAILDKVADESDAFLVVTVDVDECPELTARFKVRGMPTLLVFKAGEEKARQLGLVGEQRVRSLVGVGRSEPTELTHHARPV